MRRIGASKSTGSRKTQCQKPAKAQGLGLFCMQSTISTEPMIAERGAGQSTRGTKSRRSTLAAAWISTRPRNDVRQDRFSMSFAPEQIRYAQGFFTVKAFIAKVYRQILIGARVTPFSVAIYWPYSIRTSEGRAYA